MYVFQNQNVATVYSRYVYGHLWGIYLTTERHTSCHSSHLSIVQPFSLYMCVFVLSDLINAIIIMIHISCLGVQTKVASFHLLFHLLSSCSSAPTLCCSPADFPNITPKISPCFHLVLKKSYYSVKLVQRMWLLRDIIPKRKHS